MSTEKAYPLAVLRRRRYLFGRFKIDETRVLELGALDMPTFEPQEAAVDYMDYYSDEEFRQIASKGGLSRPLNSLVSVNHVVKTKRFAAEVSQRYDLIIAAHVIEHIPDPIAWLSELTELLEPGGRIFLAIPDRRYTLDYKRKETSPLDLVRAFRSDAKVPDLYSIADFYFYKRNIHGREVWSDPGVVERKIAEPGPTLKEALEKAERALASGSEHANVHCNVFSFPTFKEVWEGIKQVGLLPLELEQIADVQRDGNEFWVLLKRDSPKSPKDRKATKKRKFLKGKEGFLFLDNDTNNTIAQISGNAPLSDLDLGRWRRLIRSRQVLLADMGASYKFVIAPAKEAVLAQYLPDEISLSVNRPAVQLYESQSIRSTVKYPIEVLRQLQAQSYSKGDSHWTDIGGLAVFKSIVSDWIEAFGLKVPEIQDYNQILEEVMGDLAVHAEVRSPEIVTRLKAKRENYRVVLNNRHPNRGNIIITENPEVTTRPVVIFRDSFSNTLIQYFAATFSRCVFVWNPFVDYDLVERERPFLVMNIMAERFLPIVPDDINKFSWEQIEMMKRSLG